MDVKVNEIPDNVSDVKDLLDRILADIASIVAEHHRTLVSVEELKAIVFVFVLFFFFARELDEKLTLEAKKLLQIGNRSEASKIDPKNYELVSKFVCETFQVKVLSFSTLLRTSYLCQTSIIDTTYLHNVTHLWQYAV